MNYQRNNIEDNIQVIRSILVVLSRSSMFESIEGLNHLNFFHQRSLNLDQGTTNESNEASSHTTTPKVIPMSKEEEILEKTRQMIEESEAKNEQLAEQVKLRMILREDFISIDHFS